MICHPVDRFSSVLLLGYPGKALNVSSEGVCLQSFIMSGTARPDSGEVRAAVDALWQAQHGPDYVKQAIARILITKCWHNKPPLSLKLNRIGKSSRSSCFTAWPRGWPAGMVCPCRCFLFPTDQEAHDRSTCVLPCMGTAAGDCCMACTM